MESIKDEYNIGSLSVGEDASSLDLQNNDKLFEGIRDKLIPLLVRFDKGVIGLSVESDGQLTWNDIMVILEKLVDEAEKSSGKRRGHFLMRQILRYIILEFRYPPQEEQLIYYVYTKKMKPEFTTRSVYSNGGKYLSAHKAMVQLRAKFRSIGYKTFKELLAACRRDNFERWPPATLNEFLLATVATIDISQKEDLDRICIDYKMVELEYVSHELIPKLIFEESLLRALAIAQFNYGFCSMTALSNIASHYKDLVGRKITSDRYDLLEDLLHIYFNAEVARPKVRTDIIPETPECYFLTKNVPTDLIKHIFSFLDYKTLGSLTRVCKSWASISNTPALWENLCTNRLKILDNRLESKAWQNYTNLRKMISEGQKNVDWKQFFIQLCCNYIIERQLARRMALYESALRTLHIYPYQAQYLRYFRTIQDHLLAELAPPTSKQVLTLLYPIVFSIYAKCLKGDIPDSSAVEQEVVLLVKRAQLGTISHIMCVSSEVMQLKSEFPNFDATIFSTSK